MFNSRTTIHSYDKIASAYLERNRNRTVIQEHMDRFTHHLKRGDIIIDVGCGPGFDTIILRSKGFKVFALDRSAEMIAKGRQEFQEAFVQADMRYLPFNNKINGLWVNASLLHLQRQEVSKTLCRFYQALLKEGILFISVKEGIGEGWDSCPYGGETPRWFTYWEEEQLDMLLKKEKFRIIESWSNAGTKGKWLIRICKK